jgi:1,4-alpha-glucan branching enzyme
MASTKTTLKSGKTVSKQVELIVSAEDAREVIVTGDFTEWSTAGIPLSKAENGSWKASFKCPPGEYQYRLRVDGHWQDHSEAQRRVPNPFGTQNCVLTVS